MRQNIFVVSASAVCIGLYAATTNLPTGHCNVDFVIFTRKFHLHQCLSSSFHSKVRVTRKSRRRRSPRSSTTYVLSMVRPSQGSHVSMLLEAFSCNSVSRSSRNLRPKLVVLVIFRHCTFFAKQLTETLLLLGFRDPWASIHNLWLSLDSSRFLVFWFPLYIFQFFLFTFWGNAVFARSRKSRPIL